MQVKRLQIGNLPLTVPTHEAPSKRTDEDCTTLGQDPPSSVASLPQGCSQYRSPTLSGSAPWLSPLHFLPLFTGSSQLHCHPTLMLQTLSVDMLIVHLMHE